MRERRPEIPDIVWLSEISKNDVAIGGGKGANLAEMYNLRLPVPPAFIVTASAYEEFMKESGLMPKVMTIINNIDMENTAQLEADAKKIQQIITDARVPEDLQKQIIEAYENLNVDREILERASLDVLNIIRVAREPAFVAIRSSATAEDLESASFAGQQETFLNIKGNRDLIDAVRKCWASLFTARAIYYREKNNFRHDTTYLAVVIQKMVNSDKAGVLFTVNPVTNNDREIIIEAAFGLGEGVVSGAIAPDRYILNKLTGEVTETKIGRKLIFFTRDPRTGATIKADLPPMKINQQVLNSLELKQLYNYSLRIEQHYKHAQDIEWAVEAGNVYILQSRPVTTLKKEIKEVKIAGKPILEGLAASPGIASGPVRMVYTIDDLSKIQKGDILVTKMTNPDMVVTMQKSAAIVTDEGGQTAHAAIVSREIGLPCVVGTRIATKLLREGQLVTVDGKNGKIYEGSLEQVQLPAEIAETIIERPEEAAEEKVEQVEEKPERKEVIDNIIKEIKKPKERIPAGKLKIYMNLGEPERIFQYKDLKFDGIGLMRVEFIIASQIRKHPNWMIELGKEDDYVNKLAAGINLVAKEISPRPVVVRFSDFKSNEYKNLEGGYKYEEEESNPMIGFRGVSRYVSKEFEESFRLECKAIKQARQECNNVWVMLPFVRTTREVEKCLKIMESEGLVREENFKIWLMAEVPAIAFVPEEFAKLPIDGASIGSNDLTQLIVGVDRDSALLGRMGYFDERNPAVLKAIENIINGFHKEGKTVSICGQAPSVYPEMVEFLLKKGIDSISANPDAVNSVRSQVESIKSGAETDYESKTIDEIESSGFVNPHDSPHAEVEIDYSNYSEEIF